MSEIVLEARDLTKHYGKFVAVEKLNLIVRRGEVFGLLGPNGAGKTTCFYMLVGPCGCVGAPNRDWRRSATRSDATVRSVGRNPAWCERRQCPSLEMLIGETACYRRVIVDGVCTRAQLLCA